MDNKELIKFVDWLMKNDESPKDASFEETVSWINSLSQTDDGKETLGRLLNTYKNSNMTLFKDGGKLKHLLCLKSGGKGPDCGCNKKIEKTQNEAFQERERTSSFQPGGSIARRIWNRITGNDTYVDGYGTVRHHTPVRESAHRTILKAADSPLIQAIPVVGDIADGYVAADYAKKGDYKPAIAAIGSGLILPNAMEVAGRMVPKNVRRNAVEKATDLVGDKVWIPEQIYDDMDEIIDYGTSGNRSTEPWWGWDSVEYRRGGILNKTK